MTVTVTPMFTRGAAQSVDVLPEALEGKRYRI
jgi:hypothetical protein